MRKFCNLQVPHPKCSRNKFEEKKKYPSQINGTPTHMSFNDEDLASIPGVGPIGPYLLSNERAKNETMTHG